MNTSRVRQAVLCGFVFSAFVCGLMGAPAAAHAAQRTVVGELFSQDG